MHRSYWRFVCAALSIAVAGCAGAESKPIQVERSPISATNPDRDDWPTLKDQDAVFEGELCPVYKIRAGSITGPDWRQLCWDADSLAESIPVFGGGINDMEVGSRVRLIGKLRVIRHQPFNGAQQGAGAQEGMGVSWDEYLLEVTSIERIGAKE